jgi:hypothetical protein
MSIAIPVGIGTIAGRKINPAWASCSLSLRQLSWCAGSTRRRTNEERRRLPRSPMVLLDTMDMARALLGLSPCRANGEELPATEMISALADVTE